MYNTQVHRSTNTSPYSLVQIRHQPGLSLLSTTNIALKATIRETSPQAMLSYLERRLHHAQRRTSTCANSKQGPRQISIATYPSRRLVVVDVLSSFTIRRCVQADEPATPSRNKHVTNYSHKQLHLSKYYKYTIRLW